MYSNSCFKIFNYYLVALPSFWKIKENTWRPCDYILSLLVRWRCVRSRHLKFGLFLGHIASWVYSYNMAAMRISMVICDKRNVDGICT